MLAASILYVALYPRKSTWGIMRCSIESIEIVWDWQLWCVCFNINISSIVTVFNPNIVGSILYGAKHELFVVFSTYDVRRLGWTEIEDQGLFIPGYDSSLVRSKGVIEKLDLPFAFSIVYEIWKNGGILSILALGSAVVKPQLFQGVPNPRYSPAFFIGMKCQENVTFSKESLISLKYKTSQNCNYSYSMSLRSFQNYYSLGNRDILYL